MKRATLKCCVKIISISLIFMVSIFLAARKSPRLHSYLFQRIIFAAMSLGGNGRLELAVLDHNVSVAEDLLNKGADPNQRGRDNETFLMNICTSHDPHSYDMAQVLLAHGADPQLQDTDGYTALMFAAQSSTVDMVNLLLQHGARVDIRNNREKTAFDIAKERNKTKIVSLLEKVIAQPATNN